MVMEILCVHKHLDVYISDIDQANYPNADPPGSSYLLILFSIFIFLGVNNNTLNIPIKKGYEENTK